MESIMNYLYEYEKYYRRSPINFFHSICFLFENEKTNWEWNDIEGHCGMDGNEVWVWSSLLLAGRLWAAAAARQGAQREDERRQTNSNGMSFLSLLFSISWRNERNWEKRERELVCEWNEWNVMWAACLSFLKWNGREENKRGNGMEWMKRRPKQPKAARQAEMESNQTEFIVCVWWMEWKGWVGSSLGG